MKYTSFRISVSRRDAQRMSQYDIDVVTDLLANYIKLAAPVREMEQDDFVDFNYSGYVSDDFSDAVFENHLYRIAMHLQFSMFTTNLAVIPRYETFACHECNPEIHAKAKEAFYSELFNHIKLDYDVETGRYQAAS